MKKRILPFLALGLVVMSAASCKKCTTCTYTWTDPNGISRNFKEEYCGDRKEIKVYEQNTKYTATVLGAEADCK